MACLRSGDIEHSRRVGDMSDLRIGGLFRGLRERHAAEQTNGGRRRLVETSHKGSSCVIGFASFG